MEKFTTLTGVPAPMDMINIDTDMIIPKQFLKTIGRTGLGPSLFFEMRYLDDGSENPDFVLNKPQYRDAKILIAGENFGCGSSREGAVFTLVAYGFRSIIAPGFGDIFFNNCYKNGLLPVVLTELQVDHIFNETNAFNGYKLTIDLDKQLVVTPGGNSYPFDIAPFRKYCMLNGFDDIGLSLRHADKIKAYEAERVARMPWLNNRVVG